MSLPIYLTPFEEDIISELKRQGYSEKDIYSLVYDFKGRKREEEFLKFINDNMNMPYEVLIYKKIELRKQYPIFWGYIVDKDGCEIYDPDQYRKNLYKMECV